MTSHLFYIQGVDETNVKRPALTVRISSLSRLSTKKQKIFSLEKSINFFTSFKTVTIKGYYCLFDKSAMGIGSICIAIDIPDFIHLNF